MKDKVNIVILEPYPIVAKAMSGVIENASIRYKTKTFTRYLDAFEFVTSNAVDLIVLDIQLDYSDGFTFLSRIKDYGFVGNSIFYTALEGSYYLTSARRVGADALCKKMDPVSSLLKSINTVVSTRRSLLKKTSKETHLSNRETLVLSYLKQGLSNKNIAERLELSPKTISTYKHRLLKKLDARNAFEITSFPVN